ncbi:MAG: 4-hydroxy-tetrahydrodipicolinate synthase [Clostridiales bacterium]|nr:4-hydroxy-tetrahydrodipicolinate synthase [Clostridiales bacterium]
MKKCIFSGVATAVITPFSSGNIDYCAFETILQKQIDEGADAVVVLGTTGEPCTVSDDERTQIIKTAVKVCGGKIKVVVGCGSNSTLRAIWLYQMAERLGVDGALIVTPYYNKCTQNGIVEHYKQISNSGNLPIIAYNVPSRTGVNILPQTALSLSKIKNVCGIKEASGNISQILEYFKLLKGKIAIYSGEDSLNGIFMCLGGNGFISVASNAFPKIVKRVYNLGKANQFEKMYKVQTELLPVINALFLEVNPIPIKAAMHTLGLCKNELRSPLTKMSPQNFAELKKQTEILMGKAHKL